MLPVLGPRDYRALMSNLKSKDRSAKQYTCTRHNWPGKSKEMAVNT